MVGSVWANGEWAESHWIMCVISFQKIYGLYSVKQWRNGHKRWVVGGFVGMFGMRG